MHESEDQVDFSLKYFGSEVRKLLVDFFYQLIIIVITKLRFHYLFKLQLNLFRK